MSAEMEIFNRSIYQGMEEAEGKRSCSRRESVYVSLDVSPLELAVRLCERILINCTRVQHVIQVDSRKWY